MKKFMYPVPERIKRKTAYLQKHYCMGLYDAFRESVRDMTFYERQLFPELQKAWTDSDYRNYIPQEYIDIALNEDQLAFKNRYDCIKLC